MPLPITLEGDNYPKVRKTSDGIYVQSEWALVQIPYETERQKYIACRMEEIQNELSATDYRAAKYAEGLYTEEEYAPYKALRQSLRDEYNELEEEYTPPTYTEEMLENAKRLFLAKDFEMRRQSGGPNVPPVDPWSFLNME